MIERLLINFVMMRTYVDPDGPFVRYADHAAEVESLANTLESLRRELGETRLVLEATDRNADRIADREKELESALDWLLVESGGKAIPNSSLDAARNHAKAMIEKGRT